MDIAPAKKKERADSQISSLSGEFFVAAELLKREIQTSVTFGNAKAIDLFAHNPRTRVTHCVQVKTLRYKNFYPLRPEKVDPAKIYVFVLLNKPGQAVRYFVVPGAVLLDDVERFGRGFKDPNFPGIYPQQLEKFEDNWVSFEGNRDGSDPPCEGQGKEA